MRAFEIKLLYFSFISVLFHVVLAASISRKNRRRDENGKDTMGCGSGIGLVGKCEGRGAFRRSAPVLLVMHNAKTQTHDTGEWWMHMSVLRPRLYETSWSDATTRCDVRIFILEQQFDRFNILKTNVISDKNDSCTLPHMWWKVSYYIRTRIVHVYTQRERYPFATTPKQLAYLSFPFPLSHQCDTVIWLHWFTMTALQSTSL